MTELLLEYDESVDAAYLMLSDQPWHHQERLDDARGIDYAADVKRVLRSGGFRILDLRAR